MPHVFGGSGPRNPRTLPHFCLNAWQAARFIVVIAGGFSRSKELLDMAQQGRLGQP